MSVKLYYFDGGGICEPIRWILSYGAVDFEEVRVPVDNFPEPTILPEEIKSKCRWGQVPLIEFDGKVLTQSRAICRYFARKFNLVPDDPFQSALCDEYVESIRDFMLGFYALGYHPGPSRDEKMNATIKTHKPIYLDVFDSIIQSNGGSHLVGGSLTWADIWLAYSIDQFQLLLKVDLAEGSENIKKLRETVKDTPKIKAWLEKRPNYKF